jgi:23S rRNA (adenine2503-C2)-methyltransferase
MPEDWADALRPLGGRAFHARQIFRWVQARSVFEPERMTDLPKELRAGLAALELERTLQVTGERRAADGTRKLLATFRDGATVETVLIPGVTGPRGRLPSPVAPAGDGTSIPSGIASDAGAPPASLARQ